MREVPMNDHERLTLKKCSLSVGLAELLCMHVWSYIRYTNDTVLIAYTEKKLQGLLQKIVEENEKKRLIK